MQYEIRAMGLGEILDQTAKLMKDKLKLLVGISLVLYGSTVLLQQILIQVYTPVLPENPTSEQIAQQAASGFTLMAISLGFVFLQLFLVNPLTDAAMIVAVSGEYLGKPVTVGQAFGKALGIFPRLLATGLLKSVIIILGLICFIIPGVYFMFRYWLSPFVVVLENKSMGEALRRSKELMKPNNHINTAFVLGLLLGVIGMAVGAATEFVPFVPLQVVLFAMVSAALFAAGSTASVIFYFSCRSRVDSFDLTLLADAVEQGGAPSDGSISR